MAIMNQKVQILVGGELKTLLSYEGEQEKQKFLEENYEHIGDSDLATIIQSLENDDIKKEYIQKLIATKDSRAASGPISSLTNDTDKMQFLSQMLDSYTDWFETNSNLQSAEKARSEAIERCSLEIQDIGCSLESSIHKKELLDMLKSPNKAPWLLISLEGPEYDEYKLKYFFNLDSHLRVELLKSLSDKELARTYVQQIGDSKEQKAVMELLGEEPVMEEQATIEVDSPSNEENTIDTQTDANSDTTSNDNTLEEEQTISDEKENKSKSLKEKIKGLINTILNNRSRAAQLKEAMAEKGKDSQQVER